jgi:hypothetical protein
MTTQRNEFGVRSGETRGLRLGTVGAGKLGTTVARAGIEAGDDVAMSGSGTVDRIALTVEALVPGARAVTTGEVTPHADLIVPAVPTHRFRELTHDLYANKIVIDAIPQSDRRGMLCAFDLPSYDDVSRHGAAILARLEDGAMLCDGHRPADQVDAFRRWVTDEDSN